MARQDGGIALVTGASMGIGAAYADRLARRGYDLILVARSREKLDVIAATLARETGRSVEVLVADLGKRDDLAHVETVLRTNARITMLVNNAGIGATAPLLRSDVNRMGDMIALNVTALMRLTYAAAPGFVARGGGTIVNISSIVAVGPEILNGVYGGTKAFVLAFSQSLHHELVDKGIRVQVVLPGATATDFWELAGTPVENLPSAIVMRTSDLVDAALVGLDLGEFATFPSLPDVEVWMVFENARLALKGNLSHSAPASRYHVHNEAA